MDDATDALELAAAPAGYRLGDPISLADLLALPPDGRRYARDRAGRLALMPPDSPDRHRYPLGRLVRRLNRTLGPRYETLQEASLALPRILRLGGGDVPASALGPRAVEPDVVVFDGRPHVVPGAPPGRARGFTADGLVLVVEVLSPGTWRSDLGLGRRDDVDRWRTYLESGVPEYWVLNAGVEAAPLPVGSGLFLRNAGDAWRPLRRPARRAAGARAHAAVHGVEVVWRGVVRSRAVEGLTLDVAAFFAEARL